MATQQGKCRNCGALVIFDDRFDECECVFCHCIFPSSEAIALLENSEGHEFKNEKFDKVEGGKHYYSTPVSADIVSKAAEREMISKANSKDSLKIQPSEFEVSPSDVKAPLKYVIALVVAVVLIIGVVIAIALPMYSNRVKLNTSVCEDIDTVFAGVCEVQTEQDEDGNCAYSVFGRNCQNLRFQTSDEITEAQAQQIFDSYSLLRNSKGEFSTDKTGDINVEIYTPTKIYYVTQEGVTLGE
ncbi:MAG: hypothetical protein K5745_07625 [Saccharofermentans sp.]|nr:hypothetical protein [Saccharofermentans sp.]